MKHQPTLVLGALLITTILSSAASAASDNNQDWNLIINDWDAEQLFETLENAGLEKTQVNNEQRYVSELINCSSTRPSEFTLKEGCYFYQDGQRHNQNGFKPAFSMMHFMRYLGLPIENDSVPVTEEYEIKNVTCAKVAIRGGNFSFYCRFTGKPGSLIYNQAEIFYKLAEGANVPSVAIDATTKVITMTSAVCRTKTRAFATSIGCELTANDDNITTVYKPTIENYISPAHWYMRKLGTTRDYFEGQDLTVAEGSFSSLICKQITNPRGGVQYTCTYKK